MFEISKDSKENIMIENETTTLFGMAYLIKDGNMRQICEKDKSICIT